MNKNHRLIYLVIFGGLMLVSCSTTVIISDRQKLFGKKIAIVEVSLNAYNNTSTPVDTLCDCMGSTIAEHMNPFFMEAGMTVVDLPVSRRSLSRDRVRQMVDSLGLDFILVGTGTVHVMGKRPGKQSFFMRNLSMKLIGGKNMELVATGEFFGGGVYPEGAVKRIGKKFLKSIRKDLSGSPRETDFKAH